MAVSLQTLHNWTICNRQRLEETGIQNKFNISRMKAHIANLYKAFESLFDTGLAQWFYYLPSV